ncbi:MAG: transcriptional regulator [Alphaproteobacteria bacterium]|nr:transcriptional regulator [Alphaproteobacteria bacterium]
MNLAFQFVRFGVLAVVTVALLFVAGVFAFIPGERRAAAAPAVISADEAAATLAALKPPMRARPVVALVGASGGTETTDYLVPYGVLKRSGVADVFALGTKSGPVSLMPALTVVPDATTAEFVRRYPDGADYVIVPALHDPTDVDVRDFIRAQAARGATIVSICDGTLVMANAGLLDGHNATGHWFHIDGVAAAHPTMHRVRDRRYVADRGIVTTTGVSASVPVSLALVEAIGGRERATALAQEIGARGWSAEHDSGAFHLIRDDVWMILGNLFLGLIHGETIGVRATDGADVIAVAFMADSYGRTFRSRAVVLGSAPVRTAEGLQILPDAGATPDVVVDLPRDQPAFALDSALAGIKARYGGATSAFVRVQLEDRGHATGR